MSDVTEIEVEVFDPVQHNVAEVLDHLAAADDAERERVLAAEADGKARKGVLEALAVGELGPVGLTTSSLREDYMGQDLVAPTTGALDSMGRATTATVDYMGRPLRRTVRSNSLAVTLGQEIQYVSGAKFVVKTAGTTHASVIPTVPAIGADVTDGTAVLTRTK